MKLNDQLKKLIIEIISLLYILLFVYAAVSKILDFENFKVQLGQSPLLSAFAGFVAYSVPSIELLISLFLLVNRCRLYALYAAFGLMVMFTAYIYIILNYSSFIPCSCGGILEDLSWDQHIIFNIVFIILAIIAILLFNTHLRRNAYFNLSIGTIFCIGFIALLFNWSEQIIHYHNNFVRRFPHFPAVLKKEVDLEFDSYYFAGGTDSKIYLGNYTAPLRILEMDSNLNSQKIQRIKLDRMNLPFTAIQIKVRNPYFYLVDGNAPCIFRGKISNWKGFYQIRGEAYFSHIEPLDSTNIVFRTILKKTKTNTLGKINLNDTTFLNFEPNLIQKQIDGVFDTDGLLHYDKTFKKVVYVYAYRNQFIIADSNLKLNYRGNTIDTTAHAKLKVVTIANSGETKFGAPPLIVNKTSALHKNLLFVSSGMPGKYESLVMWKKASIVDVYDIEKKTYLLSFYVYDIGNKKMRSFYIQNNYLYALIGDKLVSYKLGKVISNNYK